MTTEAPVASSTITKVDETTSARNRVVEIVELHVGPVAAVSSVSGGDVAASFALDLRDGSRVFAKTHTDPPPKFFSTEAAGLSWLAESKTVRVPEVLAVDDDAAVLVLEWITVGSGRGDEEAFGRALAQMHRFGAPAFGRQDRRTTGSRSITNEPCDTWVEFYSGQRLMPLTRLAQDGGSLPRSTISALATIANRLGELGGQPEPPARLHGDLWAGNRLVDENGQSWLIDPACHGGHREYDLAMMRLFGGFDPVAFVAYNQEWPLSAGFEDRILLHQLAPLVVHAIKFGGPYVAATENAANQYL